MLYFKIDIVDFLIPSGKALMEGFEYLDIIKRLS